MQNTNQKANNETNDRVCVRCKNAPGISNYQYHCQRCYSEIQENQAKPDPTQLSDAELQEQYDYAAKIEEELRQKQREQKKKEEEEKKKNFWQYQYQDKYGRGRHMEMRMLRNWNGGKVSSPIRQARLLIHEVLLQDVQE